MTMSYKRYFGVLVFFIVTSSVSASKELLKIRANPSETNSSTGSTDQANSTPISCSSNDLEESTYNLGLHIGAFFIILATSSFGAFLPVIAKRRPNFKVPRGIFFVTKNFGTGVILATAFIHMLPSAFSSLTNPCLPSVWTNYNSWPGAIAMMAALSIFFLEYFSIKLQAAKDTLPTNATQNNEVFDTKDEYHHSHHGNMLSLTKESQILGIVILETGICFHSVIIGMALSVESGATFISLLVALVFHQLFEGLGLGSRIAELGYKEGSYKPWLMSFAYGTTTPLGIAIGIGIRQTYNTGSATALITQGVLDSVSAGILLYAALVELIANDFIHDNTFRKKSNFTQNSSFLCLITGAGIMGLIGYWA